MPDFVNDAFDQAFAARCWFYVERVCRKGPDDYCKILRSK